MFMKRFFLIWCICRLEIFTLFNRRICKKSVIKEGEEFYSEIVADLSQDFHFPPEFYLSFKK